MKALEIDTTNYEYGVLVDVVSTILLGPFPNVELMARHAPATAADSELAIRTLRYALPPSLQEVWCLQQHLTALSQCASVTFSADV